MNGLGESWAGVCAHLGAAAGAETDVEHGLKKTRNSPMSPMESTTRAGQ